MLWYFSMYQRFSLLYLGMATGTAAVVPDAFQMHGQVTDESAYSAFGRLYAIGYIRGLQQAVYGSK